MKKKEISNQALAGDKNKLLDDYIKAVVEAQSQCLEHTAFLKEHGCMDFIDSNSTLNLNDREIIRISVSLFDSYALNEHFNTMIGIKFSSSKRYKLEILSDMVTEKEIKREEKRMDKANKKLESIQKNFNRFAGKDLMNRRLNELNAWNLSLEHILFLLKKSEEDSKELDEELQMMRNIMSCSSDFYIEYENARGMHSYESV